MSLKLSLNITASNPADFTQFGYVTIDVLTPGQFGKTYVVEDMSDPDTTYVAKSVDMSNLTEKEQMNCKLEADLLKVIDHPTILKCKETFMHGSALVLILEHCKGGDLQEHMDRRQAEGKPYSEAEIQNIFTTLMEGLDYLHTVKKIIHRDIKPANILISEPDDLLTVKIADFGISRMMNQTLQMAQTHIGTPAYMSPEMLRGNYVSPDGSTVGGYTFASDIWALGCVLWEIASGKSMYDAHSIGNLVHIITNRRRKTPKIERDDLSDALKQSITLMLSHSVSQRSTPRFYLDNHVNSSIMEAAGHATDVEGDMVELDCLRDILLQEFDSGEESDSIISSNTIASFLRYYRELMFRGGVVEVFMITAMDVQVETTTQMTTIIEEDEEDEYSLDSDVSDHQRDIYQTKRIRRAMLNGIPNAADCPDTCLDEKWNSAWLKRSNRFFQMGLTDDEMDEICLILQTIHCNEMTGDRSVRDLLVLFGTPTMMNKLIVELWQTMCLFRVQTLIGHEAVWTKHLTEEGNHYIIFENADEMLKEANAAIEIISCIGKVCARTKSKMTFKSSLVCKFQRVITPKTADIYYRACKRNSDGHVIIANLTTEITDFLTGRSGWNHHPVIPKVVDEKTPRFSSTKKNQRILPHGSNLLGRRSFDASAGSSSKSTPINCNEPVSYHFGARKLQTSGEPDDNAKQFSSDSEAFTESFSAVDPFLSDAGALQDSPKSLYAEDKNNDSYSVEHGSVQSHAYDESPRMINTPIIRPPHMFHHPSPEAPVSNNILGLLVAWNHLNDLKLNAIMAMTELVGLLQDEISHTAKVMHLCFYTRSHDAVEDSYSARELDVEHEVIHAVRDRLGSHLTMCHGRLIDVVEFTSKWDPEKNHYLRMATPLANERDAQDVTQYFSYNIHYLNVFVERYRTFCLQFDMMCSSNSSEIPSSLHERKQFCRQFEEDVTRCMVWIQDVILSFIPAPRFLKALEYHLDFDLDIEFIVTSSGTVRTLLELNEAISMENVLLTAFISLNDHDIVSGREQLKTRIQAFWDIRKGLVKRLTTHIAPLRSFKGFLVALHKRDQHIIDFLGSDKFLTQKGKKDNWHRNKLLMLCSNWRFSRLSMNSVYTIAIRSIIDDVYNLSKKASQDAIEFSSFTEMRHSWGRRSRSQSQSQFAPQSPFMHHEIGTGMMSSTRSVHSILPRIRTPARVGVKFNSSGDPDASPSKTYHAFEGDAKQSGECMNEDVDDTMESTPSKLNMLLNAVAPSPKMIGILKKPVVSYDQRPKHQQRVPPTGRDLNNLNCTPDTRLSVDSPYQPYHMTTPMTTPMNMYQMHPNWSDNFTPTPQTTPGSSYGNVMTPSPMQHPMQHQTGFHRSFNPIHQQMAPSYPHMSFNGTSGHRRAASAQQEEQHKRPWTHY